MALTKVSTGMLSADAASVDLNIDAGTMFIDASANRVGIGTTSPSAPLTVNGTNAGIRFIDAEQDPTNYYGEIYKDYNGNAPFVVQSKSNGNGVIALNPDGGNVGIGTASPSSIANYVVVEAQGDTTTTGGIYYTSSSDSSQKAHYYIGGGVGYLGTQTNHPFAFTTNNTERMRIDSSGLVGIGTSSPTAPLTVNGGTASAATIQLGNHGDNAAIHAKYSLAFKADSTEAIADRSIAFSIGTHSAFYSNVAATIFNEGGANTDFRVESTSNANALFVDASSNRVGILTASPSEALHVTGRSRINSLYLGEVSGSTDIIQGTSGNLYLTSTGSNLTLGSNSYFNGGNVGIGTSSPSSLLSVKSDVNNNVNNGILFEAADSTNKLLQLYENSVGECYMGFYQANVQTALIRTNGNSYFNGGNVGIGTTSPKGKINSDVGNTSTVGAFSNSGLNITSTSGAVNNIYQIGFGYASGATNAPASIYALTTSNAGFNNNAICFATRSVTTDTAPTERMRIDSSGNLLVGTTTSATKLTVQGTGTGDVQTVLSGSTANTNVGMIVFRDGASEYCGQITSNGSTNTVSYVSASDQRLKENIADADDAGSKIDAIQVRQYDWKKSNIHQDYGVIAQELAQVTPEAVHQPENPEEMMGVDYSKLVPMMLKEIQSLRARVAQLES